MGGLGRAWSFGISGTGFCVVGFGSRVFGVLGFGLCGAENRVVAEDVRFWTLGLGSRFCATGCWVWVLVFCILISQKTV